jgi:hypothetical protein
LGGEQEELGEVFGAVLRAFDAGVEDRLGHGAQRFRACRTLTSNIRQQQ